MMVKIYEVAILSISVNDQKSKFLLWHSVNEYD